MTTSQDRQLAGNRDHELIPANGRSLATAATANRVSQDLSPMMAEIKEIMHDTTETRKQDIAEATKPITNRGGQVSISKGLRIRRDEIGLSVDVNIATD